MKSKTSDGDCGDGKEVKKKRDEAKWMSGLKLQRAERLQY
jgi:hypothetical protein